MDIAGLIRSGALVPVAVYGTCRHPDPVAGYLSGTCDEEDHFSYGLMDRFSKWSPGGSDCNRAVSFLLRPNDSDWNGAPIEDLDAIRAAIKNVLLDDEELEDS